MTRAAIYTRYSSQMQREASIEDQLRLCRERAASEGWRVADNFSDRAISGASMLRPGLQALFQAAQDGQFDVVLSEALDRLSRDQADIAAIYKRLSFTGVRIVTLAEGEIGELHVGLKGTMNQLFLKDLAEKTRRGLRGRVEAGRSGGGNSYGYDVIRRLGADRLPVTGERRINEAEAAIIRRVFADFAAGHSPKAIARRLNNEAIPGPRGKLWRDTAIRGHRVRGTGLLNNELYIGRLVWNRLRYVKDPQTGKRVSRLNDPSDWITTEVPELRIVDDSLWEAVKARQGKIEAEPRVQAMKATRFWEKRRKLHLLTGLAFCGSCGGPLAAAGRDYLACSAARKLGTCSHKESVRRPVLEEAVLNLLRARLMQPDAVAAFVKAFTKAANTEADSQEAARARLKAERATTSRKLDGLYDAIAEGLRTSGLQVRLEELEARISEIDTELTAPAPAQVRFNPILSELYRKKVAELAATLADPEIRTEALETVRGLIERVVVSHENGQVTVALEGALAAMIGLAQDAKSPSGEGLYGNTLECSVKVVAGAGNRRILPALSTFV
ncbi:recombinase family protein [Leisingera sp. McT4-56]|uniref:recombinase family protein n=1 Tax=Leisingera sp. McT4-56 TaxID=2881255 RepID=UPI001CF84AE2|nr:recombinase family protein [Leisingera sp. McT4-56]MCB4458005.1 recombinase family protein [Leisingera sp. McT4-56]